MVSLFCCCIRNGPTCDGIDQRSEPAGLATAAVSQPRPGRAERQPRLREVAYRVRSERHPSWAVHLKIYRIRLKGEGVVLQATYVPTFFLDVLFLFLNFYFE